jgi:hypothetical protein
MFYKLWRNNDCNDDKNNKNKRKRNEDIEIDGDVAVLGSTITIEDIGINWRKKT